MANVIIRNDERNERTRETLREYGIDPNRATASQREAAEDVAHKTNEVYKEMRRYEK